jgi:putative transposase
MGWWRVGWVIFCVGMGIVMPGPKPPEIVLGGEERAELERLVRAHTTGQQLAVRARVVLLAADGLNTSEVARALGLDVGTARQWRARWLAFREVPPCEAGAAERLADAPKPGAPARITPEQVCQILALACEQPADSGRPISQWSARELADEIVRRGITERISPRHAARVLKSGRPAAASLPLLAHPGGRGRRRGEDRRRV